MFSRVLVPLDGSQRAELAVPVAAKIAHANGGMVILVRALTMPTDYGAWAVAPVSGEAIAGEASAYADYLAHIAVSPALTGLTVERVVSYGMPVMAILDTIQTHQADSVVMTTNGRTGLTRWVLGSVARQIACQATVPVLVLHEHGPTLGDIARDGTSSPRFLVPLDGSPLAEAAVTPAAALAQALAQRAALHLALVISPYDQTATNLSEAALVEHADTYLRGVTACIQQQYPSITVTRSISTNFDAADTLIRCAQQGDATPGLPAIAPSDAIVMATHGRSGITSWVMGSVTERVLNATSLPLLVVHAPTKASDDRAFVAAGTAVGAAL